MKKFTKDSLEKEPRLWNVYRKDATVPAIRIEEPFEVETTEGTLICQDGYLAIDSRGYPYPIDKIEFENIYEKV